jgi:hypothetical protein
MRIIKLAIISFVFFFLLLTAFSLLVPSHVRISKAVNIGAEKESIFSLITDTTKWKDWHPGFQKNVQQQSNSSSIIITPVVQNDSLIIMNLNSVNRKTMVNGWQVYYYASTDSLTLQWYMDFHLQWYPWQKFGSLFYEKTYGVMMEQGLSNIKQLAEDKDGTNNLIKY